MPLFDPQRSLFGPAELARSDNPILGFEYPAPGLARALIGPVPLASGSAFYRTRPHRVHAIAVDASREVLASFEFAYRGNDAGLWSAFSTRMADEVARARAGLIGRAGDPVSTLNAIRETWRWQVLADDPSHPYPAVLCWATALARILPGHDDAVPEFEQFLARTRADLAQRLSDGIEWVLAALDPGLRACVAARPYLAIDIARTLWHQARATGEGSALAFVRQATRTEPLPALRWMAEPSGRGIAAALHRGDSLPDAIRAATGVRRCVTRYVCANATRIPDMPADAWPVVLGALDRLPRERWPTEPKQWTALARLARACRAMCAECTTAPHPDPFDLILVGSTQLRLGPRDAPVGGEQWCRTLCSLLDNDELKGAVFAALLLRELGSRAHAARAAWRVQALAQPNVEAFLAARMRLLPESNSQRIGRYTFRLLRSPREIASVGRSLGNCVGNLSYALELATEQEVLAEIGDARGLVGLCSIELAPEVGDGFSPVVRSASGPANAPLPSEAIVETFAFAQWLKQAYRDPIADYLLVGDATRAAKLGFENFGMLAEDAPGFTRDECSRPPVPGLVSSR